MRLASIALVVVLAGCVERADRRSLPAVLDRDDREASRNLSSASLPPMSVEYWRFAGTRDGEHIVVHTTRDGRQHRYALPQREFVMPADLAYSDDEARWIPLKTVELIQADGSRDLDFARLSSTEIDALRSGLLRRSDVFAR